MTGSPAPLPLPQRCWGRWRHRASGRTPVLPDGLLAPDGVWKAAIRRQKVGAAGLAMRGVVHIAGRRDGRAATFSSILKEVRSGAASEHDESGNDALARGAQSSDRRAWLSQANADRALFRGFRLPCAKTRHRSGRSNARDGGSENQGRRKGRMVSTGGISRSSLSRRAHHRRASDRHRAHQGGDAGRLKRKVPQPGSCAENSRPPLNARNDLRVTRPSFEQRTTPHPSLRATFPSRAGEGERPTPAARR
jgi:hypothetical protein